MTEESCPNITWPPTTALCNHYFPKNLQHQTSKNVLWRTYNSNHRIPAFILSQICLRTWHILRSSYIRESLELRAST